MKPKVVGRMRKNARRGSFFARDNIAMFIQFCKDLGVHSNLLFETEDLGKQFILAVIDAPVSHQFGLKKINTDFAVSHGEIRNILICLMEVGRLALKYGIDPPALVAMERQIDQEAADNQSLRTTTDEEEVYSDEANKENPKKPIPAKRSGISRIPVSVASSLKPSPSVSDSLDSGLADAGRQESKSPPPIKKTQLDLKV